MGLFSARPITDSIKCCSLVSANERSRWDQVGVDSCSIISEALVWSRSYFLFWAGLLTCRSSYARRKEKESGSWQADSQATVEHAGELVFRLSFIDTVEESIFSSIARLNVYWTLKKFPTVFEHRIFSRALFKRDAAITSYEMKRERERRERERSRKEI